MRNDVRMSLRSAPEIVGGCVADDSPLPHIEINAPG